MARLDAYAALLEKWNPAINLCLKGPALPDLWDRHFRDSAQIFDSAKAAIGHWVDLGTGGGFPGMICAILAQETRAGPTLHVRRKRFTQGDLPAHGFA